MFRSMTRWCIRHRRLVVGLWLVLIVGINAAGGALGSAYNSVFSTSNSESGRGFATVAKYFPGATSELGGSIVFRSDNGIDQPDVVTAMTAMFDKVAAIDGVTLASPFSEFGAQQIAPDGRTAFARISFAPGVDQTATSKIGAEIRDLVPAVDGMRVEVGGQALADFKPPETELIGIAFAIIVLIIAFGSVLAMGLPIGVAIAGVATGGIGVSVLLSHVITVPEFASFVGLMIGLGVGIDYALFIVTRYREFTTAGVGRHEAIEGAMDTAGRAVMVAGATVVLSLLGLPLIGIAAVAGLGVAAACTVAATVAASITLLPALLAMVGDRIEVTRWRGLIAAGFAAIALLGLGLGVPALGALGGIGLILSLLLSLAIRPLRQQVPHRAPKLLRATLAYRWSRVVQARPWTGVLIGGGVLVAMAIPIFGLRLAFSDEGNYAPESTTRQAYDLIADGFGVGFNGPLVLAIETSSPGDAATVEALSTAIAGDAGVQSVSPPIPNDPAAPKAFLLQIIPTTSPQDAVTEQTVDRLRGVVRATLDGTPVIANLTGAVPANIDISSYLGGRMLVFFGAVLAVSFVLLMMVFRSLLVPLKAVIMNLLSIAAAYGVVVMLFQWGWLGSITGLQPAPIEPFIPMMLFAIVFGLSMDYEVFLLSRVKEEYDRTGDAVNSVADGLAASARVITSAAAIMVVVFGSFLLEADRQIKLFGTGLALAVLFDATLVRMLLVPATMELLGSKNWWLPRWIDRWLPTIHVEGTTVVPRHEVPDPEPAPLVGTGT